MSSELRQSRTTSTGVLSLYPVGLALYSPLNIYARNNLEVPLGDFLVAAFWSVSVTAVATFLLAKWFKDRHLAAAVVSVAVVAFFAYGHVYDLLGRSSVAVFQIQRHRLLLPVWLGLAGVSGTWLARSRAVGEQTSRVLGWTVTSLLLMAVLFSPAAVRAIYSESAELDEVTASELIGRRPVADVPRDIYYLIVDEYARADVLQDRFGFSNAEFLSWLRQRGFKVLDRSCANYPYTHLSLASSFNMSYLQHDSEASRPTVPFSTVSSSLRRNRLVTELAKDDYRAVYISRSDLWPGSVEFENGLEGCNKSSDYLYELVRTTLLRPFHRLWWLHFAEPGAREHVVCTLDKIEEVAAQQGPKFVFAHIYATHRPYLFTSSGQALRRPGTMAKGDYIQQVEFVNRELKQVVTRIIEQSDVEPVIVLQSDHGSKSTVEIDGEDEFSDEFAKERLPIFNAVLLPDKPDAEISGATSPVNMFRTIGARYLGWVIEPVPDRFFLASQPPPYRLAEVTARAGFCRSEQ